MRGTAARGEEARRARQGKGGRRSRLRGNERRTLAPITCLRRPAGRTGVFVATTRAAHSRADIFSAGRRDGPVVLGRWSPLPVVVFLNCRSRHGGGGGGGRPLLPSHRVPRRRARMLATPISIAADAFCCRLLFRATSVVCDRGAGLCSRRRSGVASSPPTGAPL